MPPNLLFFVVNDRNIDVYRRIKKSCDIRFGVASQVLQKVNAKLGGCTSVAKSNVIPKVAPKSVSSKWMRHDALKLYIPC
jgi:eukaryotic translation initiation factor 2C